MADNSFESLKTKYKEFQLPVAVIAINDVKIEGKNAFPVSDINVELTSGFEASVAEFSIYNTYNQDTGQFKFEEVKKLILLGSKAEIFLGYEKTAQSVFIGVITRVSFSYEAMGVPCIRVTAMDVKGIMMSGSYSRQLTATNYSDAVKEILGKTAYEKMKTASIIKSVHVTDTPDKTRSLGQTGTSDRTVEMVGESDYEFVVKAAKRYNYEFFCECGNVYFRKAKSDTSVLMEIGPLQGMYHFDVSYDITGLVESITARGMNVSKAKVISAKKKFSNKISMGNKARPLLKGSQKVYLDATITSKEEAEDRVDSLMEQMSYRFGTLECEMIGMPELLPGHFIQLTGMGTGADNCFYLTNVRHRMQTDGSYTTQLTGITAGMNLNPGGGLGAASSLGSVL